MISEWVAIGVIAIIGFIFLQIEHHTRKYKIALVIIFGALVYFSVIGIFSHEQVDLTSPKGIVGSVYLYFGWIGQTASNLWDIGVDTTHLVGNAIKLNNASEENTNR